jgi:small nuclear ribonucleoprotein (snRNP)-like protein
MTKSKCESKTNAQSKGGGLGEKLALLKHLDARKPSTLVDEEICGLPTLLGKYILVLTTDGRNMYGILDCFDRNTNLVLLNVSERVFPHFDIKETTEELDVPVKWPIRPHVDGIDWELASGEPEEEDVCCIRGRNASVESVDFIRLWKPTSTMPSSSRVLSDVLCAAIQRFPKFSYHKYFHVPKIRLGKGDEHEENAAVLNGRFLKSDFEGCTTTCVGDLLSSCLCLCLCVCVNLFVSVSTCLLFAAPLYLLVSVRSALSQSVCLCA